VFNSPHRKSGTQYLKKVRRPAVALVDCRRLIQRNHPFRAKRHGQHMSRCAIGMNGQDYPAQDVGLDQDWRALLLREMGGIQRCLGLDDWQRSKWREWSEAIGAVMNGHTAAFQPTLKTAPRSWILATVASMSTIAFLSRSHS